MDCNLDAAPLQGVFAEGPVEPVYDTQAGDGGRERLQGYEARIWKKA